jgi:hypothetical protein
MVTSVLLSAASWGHKPTTTIKFLIRTLVVAVAMFAFGFVGHQLLLGRDYVSIEPIMRSKRDMQAHMPFALISCFCFSGALVWMYSQARNSKPWLGQGMRFGVAVWAIVSIPLYLTNYVIEPWPGAFVAKILGWELVAMSVLGILTARLAKSDPVAGSRSTTG